MSTTVRIENPLLQQVHWVLVRFSMVMAYSAFMVYHHLTASPHINTVHPGPMIFRRRLFVEYVKKGFLGGCSNTMEHPSHGDLAALHLVVLLAASQDIFVRYKFGC